MKIFLMRHGEAGWDSKTDIERPLTDFGRDKTALNISQRKPALETVERFICSPFLRAQQTAEIALRELGRDTAVETVEWISPESDVYQAIDQLQALACESVMLFTHQPFSSAFIEILCGIDRGYIAVASASIASMETDDVVAAGLASLHWQHG